MTRRRYWLYVIELSEVAGERTDPQKPCVYVGQSACTPEERFKQHKEGYKGSRIVKKYGIRLLPDLYEYLNPIYSREEALEMEKRLAADLSSRKGYTVFGGH